MQNSLFYTGIIGFTSGIFLRSFFEIGGLGGILSVFLMSFASALVWRLRERIHASPLFMLSLFLLCFALGALRFEVSDTDVSPLNRFVGMEMEREGVVAREPEARANTLHLYVRDEETGALFLALGDPYVDVSYGDRVAIRGALTLPEEFETDTGRTFDYRGYLKARGVSETMPHAEVTVVSHDNGNVILATLFDMKHTFMRAIERFISEPEVGLGEGLLLGVKRALGEHLEEVFRTVGIIHIVVLSGYNIMIVADSVMRFLSLLFAPRARMLVGILTIILFAILVGLSATVLRASMMAALVLIARATGRQYAVLRALALAGTIMLVVNPYLLVYDPGFQLSFLATLGLILLSPELELRLTKVPGMWGIRGYLATTLGTQLFVLPVLLYSMGTLSFVSVFSNMLVLPMVPPAMFLTFVTGVVAMLVAPLGMLIGFVAHLSLTYIIKIAELLSMVPFAAVTVPAFSWWGIVLMYVPIILLTLRLRERNMLSPDRGIPVNRNTSSVTSNDYAGWVIEEETETPLGTRSVPRGSSNPFPFR